MFRYIGNKTKLIEPIMDKINEMIGNDGVVVDLMAGTGTVSVALLERGYSVISNDVMEYSKHHLITQLLVSHEPEFEGLKPKLNGYGDVIDYLNNLPGEKGYFYKEFSPDGHPQNTLEPRKYFTSSNACKIDAIRNKINYWIENGMITDVEESILKHSLILAVNSVANISGTYGYFMSKFSKSSLNDLFLEKVTFNSFASQDTIVLCSFAEEIAPTLTADLCYIDPPYIKRQYAANYHILETIAIGDEPEAIGKSGLRNWWPKHSKFCTKTRIFDSFKKVFQMNCKNFLISYSEDGLIKIDELEQFFNQFGKVKINIVEYKRFKSNKSSKSSKINEYLIEIRR